MELRDIISTLDRKFVLEPIKCPNEGVEVLMKSGYKSTEHGNLSVHATGSVLLCGRCGFNQPVSRIN